MDYRDALHTIARRYCMERHACWAGAYRRLQASDGAMVHFDGLNSRYTSEAYATFPCYLVWYAILSEIERLETRSALTVDAVREQLAAAGWRAQTMLTTNPALPPAAIAAITDERKDSARFIQSGATSQS